MGVDELDDHAKNLEDLLKIKRSQLSAMGLHSVARKRHELVITALEDRVHELRRSVALLRGNEPPLEVVRVRPGVPPLACVPVEPEAVRDFATTARHFRSKLG